MARYVALLRGVNVGGAKRVPMAAWRTLLEGLGCENVRTLLNSGNAVFDSTSRSTAVLATRIHEGVLQTLGVTAPVIVKTARALSDIVAENPLAAHDADPARLLVAFAAEPAALQGLAPIAKLVQAPEQLHIGAHAAYLHCANGILESTAGAALLGKLGRDITTRNWATVLKIQALLAGR
jgi:uncharacterized protein (DUF1697 family)